MNELKHYGILGQKWGVRRYQNPDGSYTDAGKKRYDRLSNYKDKMAGKASRRAEEARQSAKASMRDYNDMKKYGIKSNAYRVRMEKMRDEREREYDWKRKEGAPRYRDTGLPIINDFVDAFSSDYYLSQFMSDAKSENKKYIDAAKAWEQSNKDLMEMNITDKSSRFRIWLTYVGNNA